MPDERPPAAGGPLCVEDGCGRLATARGLCNLHYKRRRRSGTLPPARTLADRLWARVSRTEGCWEWTGPVTRRGWGYISDRGRMRLVHRVSYELAFGPIPDGQVVHHTCGNPRCARPDHLDLGPRRQGG